MSEKQMSIEEVNRKIASLLRLQQSPVEAEAQAAADAAAKLANKYRIDLFEFQKTMGVVSETASISVIYEGTFVIDWRRILCRVVAYTNDCKFWLSPGYKDAATRERLGPRYTGDKWTQLKIAGKLSDIAFATQLFNYLEQTLQRMGNSALQGYKITYRQREQEFAEDPNSYVDKYGEEDEYIEWSGRAYLMSRYTPNAYADGWRRGCATRVAERLRVKDSEARSQESDTCSSSNAMVLVSVRETSLALAEEALRKAGVQLKTTTKNTSPVHTAGYAHGKIAGDGIGLDAQISTSKTAALN